MKEITAKTILFTLATGVTINLLSDHIGFYVGSKNIQQTTPVITSPSAEQRVLKNSSPKRSYASKAKKEKVPDEQKTASTHDEEAQIIIDRANRILSK